MTGPALLGVALAGAASLGLALGPLLQHEALRSAPALRARTPIVALQSLLSSHRWVRGALLGYGGLVLQIAAIALAPLWLVQAVLAFGLVIVLLVWARVRGRRLLPRERASVALLGFALLALVPAAAGARTGVMVTPLELAALAAAVGLLVVGVLRVRRSVASASRLALAAGACYGVTTVALAAVLADLTTGAGGRWMFATGAMIGLVSVGPGFAAFQQALQSGDGLGVISIMAATMNGVGVGGGVLFAAGPQPGALPRVAQLVGLVALAGAAALAASAASRARKAGPGR